MTIESKFDPWHDIGGLWFWRIRHEVVCTSLTSANTARHFFTLTLFFLFRALEVYWFASHTLIMFVRLVFEIKTPGPAMQYIYKIGLLYGVLCRFVYTFTRYILVLVWAIYYLAKDQVVQDRLRLEIKKYCDEIGGVTQLSSEALNELVSVNFQIISFIYLIYTTCKKISLHPMVAKAPHEIVGPIQDFKPWNHITRI